MQRYPVTKALYWQGVDEPKRFSSAKVRFAEESLNAHGESWTEDYELTWQLSTRGNWVTDRLEVRVVGLRSNRSSLNRALFLQRSPTGVWSSQTVRSETTEPNASSVFAGLARPGIAEPTTLAGALDCDLGLCPLTNTMPIRRLGLHHRSLPDVSERELLTAWVEVPSLRVVASRQAYAKRVEDGGRVRYRSVGVDFVTQLEVDHDGLVLQYPGLARQTQPFAVGA